MARIIERRSSHLPSVSPDEALQADRREDGSLRRLGSSGARTAGDFFAEGNLDKPMTRRDYLNLRASEEFAREETGFWSWLWNTLRGRPTPQPLNRALAAAHRRQLTALAVAAAERQAALEAEAAKREKGNG